MDVQRVAQVFIKHFWVPRDRLQFERTQSPVRVTDRGNRSKNKYSKSPLLAGVFKQKQLKMPVNTRVSLYNAICRTEAPTSFCHRVSTRSR